MAQKLSKKDIKKTSIRYRTKNQRPFLKTGQIVFCSGSYLFSGAIQKLTNSVWSHVAIIYKDEELGRVLVLEAEPYIGIRLIPLSKYLNDYKGKRRPYKGRSSSPNFRENWLKMVTATSLALAWMNLPGRTTTGKSFAL